MTLCGVLSAMVLVPRMLRQDDGFRDAKAVVCDDLFVIWRWIWTKPDRAQVQGFEVLWSALT